MIRRFVLDAPSETTVTIDGKTYAGGEEFECEEALITTPEIRLADVEESEALPVEGDEGQQQAGPPPYPQGENPANPASESPSGEKKSSGAPKPTK